MYVLKKLIIMKKKLLYLGMFLFGLLLALNITVAKNVDDFQFNLSALNNLAFADTECDAGPIEDCPGGSCAHYYSDGTCCESCCPEGKSPNCGSNGCNCS